MPDTLSSHLIVRRGGHYSMQMWWADCSCGWKTVQRDPRWRDQQVMDHLPLTGGSTPNPTGATAGNAPTTQREGANTAFADGEGDAVPAADPAPSRCPVCGATWTAPVEGCPTCDNAQAGDLK